MLETVLVIVALAAVALVLLRHKPRAFEAPATAPVNLRTLSAYEARPSLFVNRSELAMFSALERAAPPTHRVMAKVRLEDIIGVRRSVTGEGRWKLRARVKSRHVDYLVTDRAGRPCMAVELDGTSHDARARNADDLKDALFKEVGIPLVRIRVGEDFASRAVNLMAGLTPR